MKSHIKKKKQEPKTTSVKKIKKKNKNRKEKTKCTREQFFRNSQLLETKMIKKEQHEQTKFIHLQNKQLINL
jgi:hypothetical protein